MKSFRAPLAASLFALVVGACSSTGGNDNAPAQATGPTEPGASSGGAQSSGASGSGGSSGTSGSGGGSGSSGSSGTGADAGGTKPPVTIFTIVLENHDYLEVVGSANAPYINSLIATYGLATNYQDSGTHPSLPNYLTMISGATQYLGIIDLNPTAAPFPVNQPNLGTQLEAAGTPWRSYQESTVTACNLGGTGNYAPKHDPFLYFTDMQKGANGLCANRNVDYATFPTDLAAGAHRFMWITPDLVSDGHNPTNDTVAALKHSDGWVATEIPKIQASNAYKNGGIIFLTWDEAEGRTGSFDHIPMIIISENIKSAGYKSNKAYSHKSYLATVEDLLGLPRLATVASEPNMLEFLK